MNNVEVIVAEGMFGAGEEYLLDSAIRAIAEKYAEKGEWANKYGVNYENDVFMMHRYCWCDGSDCPWCLGCQCSDDDMRYFVKGEEVTEEEYQKAYDEHVGPAPYEQSLGEMNYTEYEKHSKVWRDGISEWYKMSKTEIIPEKRCKYCREGGDPAPNFHYKPLDLKVWWYKYIGRDMKMNKRFNNLQIAEMLINCIKSDE